MRQLHSVAWVDNLISAYKEKGGMVHTMREGVLLDGDMLLYSHDEKDNLKTIVIREVYVNEWSSAYSVRKYNKAPKKYQTIIDSL